MKQIIYFPKYFALALIRIYQKTISFDHGIFFKNFFPNGYCRFNPTCSEYTYQAIEKYGLIKGGAKGFWRILRCNPWSKGGNDPIDDLPLACPERCEERAELKDQFPVDKTKNLSSKTQNSGFKSQEEK